ncbi:MAG: flagellin [Methylobacter sp.]
MVINTNIASINSQRQLNKTNDNLSTTMERLSSGLRINSAKDDAAGLAIGNRMTSQIRGMGVAARNANDGISMAQTAEAAMGALTDTMQRMRDLALQSANDGGVNPGDREKMQTEFQQLNLELTRIIENTQFNEKKILNGSLSPGVNFQIGANIDSDNQISIEIDDLAATITSVTDASIGSDATATGALEAITALDNAIASIDNSRAKLGAMQSRFTTTISNLQSSIENQSAARSRITDTDFAMETANLSRGQILQQAGTAMLAQANQSKQSVMQLLQ